MRQIVVTSGDEKIEFLSQVTHVFLRVITGAPFIDFRATKGRFHRTWGLLEQSILTEMVKEYNLECGICCNVTAQSS